MHSKPGWRQFEYEVQEGLGLSATICSGNKWYDPGDAVDRSHSIDSFAILADCKFTEAGSLSLKAKMLDQWVDQAREMGKRFIMPIRFWPKGALGPRDYVVLSLDDLAELLYRAQGDDN